MEIIFQGKHTSTEAAESLLAVVRLFNERYGISQFREIHLSVTLVDESGQDVELIDSETNQAYRVFEVYRPGQALKNGLGHTGLKLVIDNTH